MKLLDTPRGRRLLRKLDPQLHREAQRVLRAFKRDALTPGMNFEKLSGLDDLYSLRIDRNYRIILRRHPDGAYEIDDIGPHDIYRRLGGDD